MNSETYVCPIRFDFLYQYRDEYLYAVNGVQKGDGWRNETIKFNLLPIPILAISILFDDLIEKSSLTFFLQIVRGGAER